jgi:hypothetical protein
MVHARLRQAHRGRVGRWTVAAALLAGAVTVLAACGGEGAAEGSEPVVRGDATTYSVGSTGPGGGKVFYVAATPFACGTSTSTCTYLEVSPSAGSAITWCDSTNTLISGIATAIGTGAKNTAAMKTGCTSGAAYTATATSSGGQTDWYLPSQDELQALADSSVTFPATTYFWGSSQMDKKNAYGFNYDEREVASSLKSQLMPVRAVRAF